MKTIMKRKLTYYRVYWNDGCVDDCRPAQYHILMSYEYMKKFVSVVKKIRKIEVVYENYKEKLKAQEEE